ncbi:hypothetical protein Cocul_00123 [Corynebacterium oculi]|uniref:Uncharacterized protein n=1 Tax=Corynebacterium oculi TaxID=1544416 RepID=A0A0Q0YEZ9_9CORY|nr:hypothetical protein Cocul_00123 [Corynebacterium oculi]
MLTGRRSGFILISGETITQDFRNAGFQCCDPVSSRPLQSIAYRLSKVLEIIPQIRPGNIILVGNQVAPLLTCVGIFSNEPPHKSFSRLSLSLHLGVIASPLRFTFNNPMHTTSIQSNKVREVAILEILVYKCLVARMQTVPPLDP